MVEKNGYYCYCLTGTLLLKEGHTYCPLGGELMVTVSGECMQLANLEWAAARGGQVMVLYMCSGCTDNVDSNQWPATGVLSECVHVATVETLLERLALLTLHFHANTAPVQHTQLMVGAPFTLNCTPSAANPHVDTVLQVDIYTFSAMEPRWELPNKAYNLRIRIRMGDAFVQMCIHREHIEIALLRENCIS